MDIQRKKQLYLIGGIVLAAVIAILVLIAVMGGIGGGDAKRGAVRETAEPVSRDDGITFLGNEGEKGEEPPEGSVTVAGRTFAPDETSVLLSGKRLTDTDLAAICTLAELESLSVSDNMISDLTPVSALKKLTGLYLSDNEIRDVSALSGLGSLKTLYLDGNPVRDLAPLYGLKSLRTLNVKNVGASAEEIESLRKALPDCSVIADDGVATVKEITLGGITFSADVKELDLGGRGITDISALRECTSLEKLNLRNNKIKDISPLADLRELEWLCLWNNEVEDLTPLMSMTGLRYLDVDTNKITDITVLGYLTGLEQLFLNNNAIRRFAPLENLIWLTRLDLKETGVRDEDLEALYDLTSLKELNLEGNEDLTANALEALKKALPRCTVNHDELLWTVELGGRTYRSDATEIVAVGKGIQSLDGLEHFTKLRLLDLDDNRVTDLGPLYGLTSLRTVSLSGNSGLSETEVRTLQARLPDCEVMSDYDVPPEPEIDAAAVAKGSGAAAEAAGSGSGYALLWVETDEVSAGIREGFLNMAIELGMNLVYDAAVPAGEAGTMAIVTAMRNRGADTVFVAADADVFAIVQTLAEELEYAPKFIQVY